MLGGTQTELKNNHQSPEPSLVLLIQFSDIFVAHNLLNMVAELKGRTV